MPAYYRATLSEFVREQNSSILGKLEDGAARQGFAMKAANATRSWQAQIDLLQSHGAGWINRNEESGSWGVLIEFPIPRRNKRIDVVILAGGAIFCIEFKIAFSGTASFNQSDVRQVEDYALDLHDFHRGSAGVPIVPILAVPDAVGSMIELPEFVDDLAPVSKVDRDDLFEVVLVYQRAMESIDLPSLDICDWDEAGYMPVPTIIEAAEELFASHDVREIADAGADKKNLTETSGALAQVIDAAKQCNGKTICFITGVPGAGKTLAGLNLAHNPALRSAGLPPSVFLTGNGPLVKVITEALAQNRAEGEPIKNVRRRASTFIQNVHGYIREGLRTSNYQPEAVVAFDEAQRAWDAAQVRRRYGQLLKRGFDVVGEEFHHLSEPEMMLKIMDRRPDWAVLVALVGGGQEINRGEAGLAEWGRALATTYSDWNVVASPLVLPGGGGVSGQELFEEMESAHLSISGEPSFHLSVGIRSPRAESLSSWVDAVLEGDSSKARSVKASMTAFPITLARDLSKVRNWLRQHCRGNRRCGLVASATALRLRSEGIELSTGFRSGNKSQYEHWFLKPWGDVRSSNQLETVASQFECQGLEVDWAGVCWGEDFLMDQERGWLCTKLNGTQRRNINDPQQRIYQANGYRVLLTRARFGMVVFVPYGDASDPTRPSDLLDSTAAYLGECGVEELG